jgi:ABC-type nitrate/sulfonate/bicarbonate transport system ATPase subunit
MHCFQKCRQEARFISLVFDAQQIVQLLYFSSTPIHHLSGGLKLCLNIVLAMNPTISLTNEHFFSLEIQTRRLYNHSNIQGIILFVTYSVDEAVVLGDMMDTLTTKFVGMRKECVNLLRSSDYSIVTSKTRLTTQESRELYFDDEIGEDGKIGITKVFH